MPDLQLPGARLFYDNHGTGPAAVFSHGLLWSRTMFRFQYEALAGEYRCIGYDHRGQGKSEVTASGYDMETLTEDAAQLIEKLGAAPAHFVGLSMGGFVGMRLAARRPELIRSLALIETAADAEPLFNRPKYKLMGLATRLVGVQPLVRPIMKIMFAPPFLNDPARRALREQLQGELAANDLAGTRRAVDGVIFRKAVSAEELARIRCPTLVLSGELDSAVVPARSRALAAQIPNARFQAIPRAGHSSSLEEPAAVTDALRDLWRRS